MFGYITVYQKELSPAAQSRYQAYYCGLCEALGRRYGALGRLCLSYDMAFMAMLHTALYDPETAWSRGRCVPHPVKPKPRAANGYLDYAADMSIALWYYNCLDNWQDDHNALSLANARHLEKYLPAIQGRWPAQCQAMRQGLETLATLEKDASTDLDALCLSFGDLLGSVFCCHDDIWQPVLQQIGRGLGSFIYLMDAYDDLEKDARQGGFNPLASLAVRLSPAQYEEQCHALLTQQMALCAQGYELLPILADSPEGEILGNTIYSGVWGRYSAIRAKHEKAKEVKP